MTDEHLTKIERVFLIGLTYHQNRLLGNGSFIVIVSCFSGFISVMRKILRDTDVHLTEIEPISQVRLPGNCYFVVKHIMLLKIRFQGQ